MRRMYNLCHAVSRILRMIGIDYGIRNNSTPLRYGFASNGLADGYILFLAHNRRLASLIFIDEMTAMSEITEHPERSH